MSQHLAHLHRSQNKAEVYRAAEPLRWCADRRCWQSFDPAILLAIFRDPNFEVCDYEGEIMKIVDGPGIDLLATAAVARYLPLAKEGCAHASLRKRMALKINDAAGPALLALEDSVRGDVRRLFSRPREFDVVAELFAPLVANLISSLSGVRVDNSTGETSPSQLFDRRLSLNRRKLVNGQIIKLYGMPIRRQLPTPGRRTPILTSRWRCWAPTRCWVPSGSRSSARSARIRTRQ
jgi:cytochrome P450